MAFIASIFKPIMRPKNIFAISSKYRGIVLSDEGQVAYPKIKQLTIRKGILSLWLAASTK
jgi:hypothetical protein